MDGIEEFGSMVEDEECLLSLELLESDAHYQLKRKLMKLKGLDFMGVYFKSSSPNWRDETVKKLLRIARIIHMDEVELYFDGNDGSTPDEYCSPRNEIKALNEVLSVVDDALKSASLMKIGMLQGLRDLLICRIHEFAEKNRQEIVLIDNYNCSKEKALLQWGVKNDATIKLMIANIEGAGRGAIATDDLNVGDIALELPISMIITEELVYESDMIQVLEKFEGMSAETMLLLWTMREKYNKHSTFKSYFDSLPEVFNTGLSFGIDAILTLDGTLLLEEIMQAKEHLRAQYDDLFPSLCNNHPDIFPPQYFTWEQFVWACELWYSNSMRIKFSDGKLQPCLIPIAGFLNHSLHPHITHYGKVDIATNSLKFPLSKPCCKGEQCYLGYGNFSSSHLITFYGFVPQGDNPYDVIPLDGTSSCWSSHMVRGTWLSKNHNIFYYGLPPPLLDLLRSARNPSSLYKSLIPENLEIELEVLEDLSSTFGGMMENLGEIELDIRESPSWDVKLALEYKNLQRKIISSILTSCQAGQRTVTNELSKLAIIGS
uniref:SET domain-containing protein n=1 Tax=Kalanchoe fedtschenkoi TaxID=63787 RepID=A0A7N0VHA7_KALFE